MLSRASMMARPFPYCSEGIDELALGDRFQALSRLRGIAPYDHVYRTTEDLGQFELKAANVERAEEWLPTTGAFIKVNHHVDVARGRRRVFRDRAEQIGVPHSRSKTDI